MIARVKCEGEWNSIVVFDVVWSPNISRLPKLFPLSIFHAKDGKAGVFKFVQFEERFRKCFVKDYILKFLSNIIVVLRGPWLSTCWLCYIYIVFCRPHPQ